MTLPSFLRDNPWVDILSKRANNKPIDLTPIGSKTRIIPLEENKTETMPNGNNDTTNQDLNQLLRQLLQLMQSQRIIININYGEKPEIITQTNEEPEYYTVKEVAQKLRVSVWTIYDWIKKGKIPAKRVGKKYLIPKGGI